MEWVDQTLTLVYVKMDKKNKKIKYGRSTFIFINVVTNDEHLIYKKNMNINSSIYLSSKYVSTFKLKSSSQKPQ